MFAETPAIASLEESRLFIPADLYTARLIASLTPVNASQLAILSALLSAAVRAGHVCLDLNQSETTKNLNRFGLTTCVENLLGTVLGRPGNKTPLILDSNRIYFARMHQQEIDLAEKIRSHLAKPVETIHLESLRAKWFEAFKRSSDTPVDWQQVACFAALRNKLCVISGGPGTGKTTIVSKLLTILTGLHTEQQLRIRLAAPTGKAAARMTEAMLPSNNERIPAAETIHRLLGWRGLGRYTYTGAQPLPLDVLIVDEVSMLDLEMASHLFAALPEQARIILLGDSNQLASVEAGAVMANLCLIPEKNYFSQTFAHDFFVLTGQQLPTTANITLMSDAVVELQTSYRFHAESGIGALSNAIKNGDILKTEEIIEEEFSDLIFIAANTPTDLEKHIKQIAVKAYAQLQYADKPETAFAIFDSLRFLTPTRHGRFGAQALNDLIAQLMNTNCEPNTEWYAGRPIMIRENAYEANLFNGDVGIALRNEQDQLRIYFQGVQGNIRSFSSTALPRHETCYVMTVHKSQGSEFANTVLIIPNLQNTEMSRELVYTALTRAKEKFIFLGEPHSVLSAMSRQEPRDSGLGAKLHTEISMAATD